MDYQSRVALREQIVVVDTETVGLDPAIHPIWEICIASWIMPMDDDDGDRDADGGRWVFDVYQIQHDRSFADPKALNLNHYWERFRHSLAQRPEDVALRVMHKTWNKHIVGINPTFDVLRLTSFMRENGAIAGWHYHSIDVSTLIVGHSLANGENVTLPWSSNELAEYVGVQRREDKSHTAEGDVRWTIAQLEELIR